MYKVIMSYPNGAEEEDDDVFATREEATEHGSMLCSNYAAGVEISYLRATGDSPELDDDEQADFEVVEVDV